MQKKAMRISKARAFGALAAALVLLVACIPPTETPTPTETPPTPTGTVTLEPSPTPPESPPPTPTLSESPLPTDTPIPTDTPGPTSTPTVPPTATNTPGPTDTPTPTRTPGLTPEPNGSRFVGIVGVPTSAFPAVVNFYARAVSAPSYMSASALQSFLASANSAGLGVIGRAQGRSAFTSGMKFDYDALRRIMEAIFDGTGIAEDPGFLGYYIVDEPCHPDKFDLTPEDMRQFYATVKGVNPNIPVLVNFGYLDCARSFAGGGPFVDVAVFTITVKKSQDANYVPRQVAAAEALKAEYPDIIIVPWLAVYEYPQVGQPLPSAAWVRETGLEVIAASVFDGIMYYPWTPSSYMGDSIEDVADDPEYIEAFRAVFEPLFALSDENRRFLSLEQ